jgi:hypothetical protein
MPTEFLVQSLQRVVFQVKLTLVEPNLALRYSL